MIGSILKLLTYIPSLLKKAGFLKVQGERNEEYEKLNEELDKKSDKLTDDNLRNLLK